MLFKFTVYDEVLKVGNSANMRWDAYASLRLGVRNKMILLLRFKVRISKTQTYLHLKRGLLVDIVRL